MESPSILATAATTVPQHCCRCSWPWQFGTLLYGVLPSFPPHLSPHMHPSQSAACNIERNPLVSKKTFWKRNQRILLFYSVLKPRSSSSDRCVEPPEAQEKRRRSRGSAGLRSGRFGRTAGVQKSGGIVQSLSQAKGMRYKDTPELGVKY